MSTIKEARTSTIILFLLTGLGIIGLYLIAYQCGIIQAVQDLSQGLIHRVLILNILLNLVTVAGVLLWYERLRLQDIGIELGKLPFAVAWGIGVWIIIQVVETIAGYLINEGTGIVPDWKLNSLATLGLLIGHLFGTALWEEIAFRGFLLKQCFLKLNRRIENKTLLAISSIFVSQLIFMLFHIPWKLLTVKSYPVTFGELAGELAGVFINGVIYALLYMRTDNLFLVMIVHALGNAPTSLIIPVLGTPNLLSLFIVLILVLWPRILRWDKEHLSKPLLNKAL